MYLKNTRNTVVGIRTKRGVFYVQPQEAIHVLDTDIIKVSSCFDVISENEYANLQNPPKVDAVNTESQSANELPTDSVQSTEIVEPSEKLELQSIKDSSEPVKDEVSLKLTETNVPSTKTSSKREKRTPRKKVTSEDMFAQLETLKQKWMLAKTAKEKETIQKQIKEIQNKINKG